MVYLAFLITTASLSVGLLVSYFLMKEDKFKDAFYVLFAFSLIAFINLVAFNFGWYYQFQ